MYCIPYAPFCAFGIAVDYEPNGYIYWPLGVNKYGYSAIFSMPVSLFAATVFSEAMWQKIWASADRKSMLFGGAVGSFLIMIAVFLFGFGGWLAAWGGYINFNTNANLYLFQVFHDEVVTYGAPPPPPDIPTAPEPPMFPPPFMPEGQPYGPFPPYAPPYGPPVAQLYGGMSARLRSWIGVIALMLAVTMNEGAIDSMQNGDLEWAVKFQSAPFS